MDQKLSDLERNYKRTFATDSGKQVLEDLKKRVRYAETLYHPGQATEELHFAMGAQALINDIIYILNKDNKTEH